MRPRSTSSCAQLVNLFDKGVPVRMSKRAGTFVTLREVVDEVGKDVFRFIMLTRKNDQALEFDFAKVTEQSKDNPVFYVQYAHARAASVMRHAAELFPGAELSDAALARRRSTGSADAAELGLIRLLAGWPRVVGSAAEAHEPHRIAFFLQDVAAQFHLLWKKGKDDATLRFLVAADPDLTRARLALVRGVAIVIASGLAVFGVEPVRGDVTWRSRSPSTTIRGARRRLRTVGEQRDEDAGASTRRLVAVALAALGHGAVRRRIVVRLRPGDAACGRRSAQTRTVPLLRADERPTKVKPDQPGGMQMPDQNKLLYNEKLAKRRSKSCCRRRRSRCPGPAPHRRQPHRRPAAARCRRPAAAAAEAAAAAPELRTGGRRRPAAAATPPRRAGKPRPAAAPKAGPTGSRAERSRLHSVRCAAEEAAREEWQRLRRANADLLGNLSANAVRSISARRAFITASWRGRGRGGDAERICTELKQRNHGCIIAR